MHYLMSRFPAALPIGMTLLNLVSLTVGFVWEKRFKEGAWKFAYAYALTIQPAMKNGDLSPFFMVLCQPG